MNIVGGVYVEECVTPRTRQLLGSAGRAVMALSKMRSDLELHTYHPPELWEDIRANFLPVCTGCHLYPSSSRIGFSYLFPLAQPRQTPNVEPAGKPHLVTGRQVVSFGCVEGDFRIEGGTVVADLQGSTATGFRVGGSTADRLALVLNAREAMCRSGKPTASEAATDLLDTEGAEVVVVKDGPNGAYVFTPTTSPVRIPAYSSRSLYKIGSGDIFSATFAHFWMEGAAPAAAAESASRHTAAYVDSPSLPLRDDLPVQTARRARTVDQIILVGDHATLRDQWFMRLLSDAIHHLGVNDIRMVGMDRLENLFADSSGRDHAKSILCIADTIAEGNAMLQDPAISVADPVIFLDDGGDPARTEIPKGRVFTDLSQAVYELFWMPI